MSARKSPAAKTTLSFGLVNVPVALLKMTAAPTDQKYDTAGPNGHPLHTEMRLFKPGTDEMIEPTQTQQRATAALGEPPLTASDLPALDPGFDEEQPMDPTAPDPVEAQERFAEAAGLNTPEQRQVLVEAESGAVVSKDKIRRGLRMDDGSFLDLTDGLAEIDEATKLEQMGIVAFMDIGQVPRELVRDSHYLIPDASDGHRALTILYHAMRAERRAAVVKWTKRAKQALGVIVADGRRKTLVVLEMAWPNHVRPAEEDQRVQGYASYEAPAAATIACRELIAAMSVTRDGSFERQRDDRELMRTDLLRAALNDQEFHVPAKPESAQEGATVEELIVESERRKNELAKAA